MNCEKKCRGCICNPSTVCWECVNVVLSITRRVEHPIVIDGKDISPIKLMTSQVPLHADMSSHASTVEIEVKDKSVIVDNSPDVAVLNYEFGRQCGNK